MRYAVRPVKPWTQVVNNTHAAVPRPPKRPSERKNDKGKKKKKKVDDDTFERPRISARAARDLKYGIKIKGIVS